MDHTEEINRIAKTIYEIVNSEGEILGSHLGIAIKPHLCTIYGVSNEVAALGEFKANYGNLARFISNHCSDWLKIVKKSGLDNVYALIGSGDAEANKLEILRSKVESIQISRSKEWKNFVNPSFKNQLLINLENQTITTGQSFGDDQFGERTYLLESLTTDDHRKIISDFIDKNTHPDDDRFTDRAFVSEDDYWSRWQDLLAKDKDLARRWKVFRREKLIDCLVQQIAAFNLSVPDSLEIVNAFSDQKPQGREHEEDQLRNHLIALIKVMEFEDLEALPIPAKYMTLGEK